MDTRKESNKQLMRYGGLAMQFFVSIGLALFIGMKADGWIKMSFPLFVWLLPLLIIVAIIYRLIKETSARK
ncbi:MAG: hypothetical protein ABI419_06375 [Ginsengibacter sp.]